MRPQPGTRSLSPVKRVASAWLVAMVVLTPVPAAGAEPLVQGRILDAAGRPVAGLPVALVASATPPPTSSVPSPPSSRSASAPRRLPPCDRTPSVSTATGADGRYAFDGVAVAEVGSDPILVAGAARRATVRAATVDPLDLAICRWEPGMGATGRSADDPLLDGAAGCRRADGRPPRGGREGIGRVADGATGAKGSGSYDRRAVEDHYVEAVLDAGLSRPRWARRSASTGPRRLGGAGGRRAGVAWAPVHGRRGVDQPVPVHRRRPRHGAAGGGQGGRRRPRLGPAARRRRRRRVVREGSVDASADQVAWRPLARRAAGTGWTPTSEAAGAPIRHLRLRSAAVSQALGITEVSAWPVGTVPVVSPPKPYRDPIFTQSHINSEPTLN